MVSERYLLDKPLPPSGLQNFLDQQVIPAAIDAAASVESGLERLACRARLRPFTAVGLAFAVGMLIGRVRRPIR